MVIWLMFSFFAQPISGVRQVQACQAYQGAKRLNLFWERGAKIASHLEVFQEFGLGFLSCRVGAADYVVINLPSSAGCGCWSSLPID